MKKSLLILAAGLFTIAGTMQSCKNGTGTGAGNAITLKLNPETGTKYAYNMDSKTTMTYSGMNTTQTMNMGFNYVVEAGEGTDKKMTVSYDHISSELNTLAGVIKFNTEDSSIPGLKELLNRPFVMIVSEKGVIKNIEGLERKGDSSLANSEEAEVIRKQLEATFTDSAMRTSMEGMLNIYPDNPVKAGDTWTKNNTISTGGMNMKVESTYKLVSVKNDIAHIDVKSKISSGGGEIESGGMHVKIELNGTSEGDMDVDTKTGLLTTSKLKQEVNGTMSMSGINAPVKMIMEITTTGTKK